MRIALRLMLILFCSIALAGTGTAAVKAAAPVQPVSPRQEKVRQARDYYSQGQKLLRDGNLAAANDAFAKAELILGRDDLSDAAAVEVPAAPAEKIPAAQQQAVSDPDAYYNAGIAALRAAEYKQAAVAFHSALNLDPGDKDACYNLAVLYENYLGNKREALKYYLRYVNLAPDAEDAAQVRSWIEQLNAEVAP